MSVTIDRGDSLATSIGTMPLSPAAGIIPAVIVLSCALVASMAPVGVSIATVFLFAGPHNWLEARYFLTRMPARWGRLASYFTLGGIGTLLLGGLFAAMPWLAGQSDVGKELIALWNSLLTVWIVALALIRSRQNPRRDWQFLIPIGFALIALTWMWPLAWSLALVYLHPLMALSFLDRELQRRHSKWLNPFRSAMLLVLVCLAGMAVQLAGSSNLSGQDLLTWQITQHAGAEVVPYVSTHFLVASHVFLELLHYLVWIVAIPSMSIQPSSLRFSDIPLARRSPVWRRVIATVLLTGFAAMFLLWGAFLTDYSWTRDVYFTIAILHVLAEIPFLIRSL